MRKFEKADLGKLPENSRFPLLHFVITPDVLFDEDGMKLSGITFLKKFLNLHKFGPKDDFGFADTKRLLVKVSIVALKNPSKIGDFFEALKKADFEEFFDQSLFEVIFIGNNKNTKNTLVYLVDVLNADLFLSADEELVRHVMNEGFLSVKTIPKRHQEVKSEVPFVLAIDFDGVLADDSADREYEKYGLVRFNEYETENEGKPLLWGPFVDFSIRCAVLRSVFPDDYSMSPFQIVLATVRGSTRFCRAKLTYEQFNFAPDMVFGSCGEPKGKLLEALSVDLFIDDSKQHVEDATRNAVYAVHALYGYKNRKSPCLNTKKSIFVFLKEKEKIAITGKILPRVNKKVSKQKPKKKEMWKILILVLNLHIQYLVHVTSA
ncbi:MAG: 5'-nucleotidase [Candidatus Magasanikbacteria bacterium]|nr:5'-nucleotidase [Candidatus Magasanikbacteria bacterium]